jgi:hypothetical protein
MTTLHVRWRPTAARCLLGLAVALVACGDSTPSSPSSPSTPPATPDPGSPLAQSGKLVDLQAARDIVDWNMHAASRGLMGSMTTLSDRETRMIAALYSLPHGTAVEADGTWRVLQ